MGGKMASTPVEWIFLDAGIFIGALLKGDKRHTEARAIVESARRLEFIACTSAGVLSEVYGALTWAQADPPHSPSKAEQAITALVEPPSAIRVLGDGLGVSLRTLKMAASHNLTARRIHDARHAATALEAGVTSVYTYDVDDWKVFESDNIQIVGPASTLNQMESKDK
jgi:predicted nucleic acid-binding protein